jgi:hypothetical protein
MGRYRIREFVMSQVIKINEPIPVQSETAAVISMIERVARDPSVDIDKLTKLMEMRAQIETNAAMRAWDDSMTIAQAQMRPVAADCGNPQTHSRYASYFALDKALRPIYTGQGLSLSFNTEPCERENYVRITCRVSKGGFGRDYRIDMPADGKGARGNDVMTRTHATGSAVTYGRRYLLGMIFNIVVGGNVDGDDDGNAAGDTGSSRRTISEEQYAEIQSAIVDAGADIQTFCTVFGIKEVRDLPAKKFDEAKTRLKNYAAKSKGAK